MRRREEEKIKAIRPKHERISVFYKNPSRFRSSSFPCVIFFFFFYERGSLITKHAAQRAVKSEEHGGRDEDTHQAEVMSVNMVARGIHIPKQDIVAITWKKNKKTPKQVV